jgi:hypothetical protein
VANVKVTVDGKVSEYNIDYDVSITVEMIDYVIRQVADGVSKAASKIARDGIGVHVTS